MNLSDIKKEGGVVNFDETMNNIQKGIFGEIKKFEPFIQGTKNGEIVNSIYKVMIKQK